VKKDNDAFDLDIINLKSKLKLAHFAYICMFIAILIWGVGLDSHSANKLGNTGNWYRMGLVFLASLLGLMALGRNATTAFRNTPTSIWFLLFYGVVAFFSSQIIPEHAFYVMWKAIEVILDVLIMIAIIGNKRSMDAVWQAHRIIFFLFLFLLVCAWVGAVVKPSLAFVPSRGVIPFTIQGAYPAQNGNSLAFVSAFIVFTSISRLFRERENRIFYCLLIVSAFITLILCQSSTSLVALFLALFVFFYFDKRKKFLVWGAIIGAPAIIY